MTFCLIVIRGNKLESIEWLTEASCTDYKIKEFVELHNIPDAKAVVGTSKMVKSVFSPLEEKELSEIVPKCNIINWQQQRIYKIKSKVFKYRKFTLGEISLSMAAKFHSNCSLLFKM